MRLQVTTRTDGLARLRQALERTDWAEVTALDVQAEMQRRVPVRTGHLRRSITVTKVSRLRALVRVGAVYGWYVNYGTARRAARPFAEPAVLAAEPRAAARLRQALVG